MFVSFVARRAVILSGLTVVPLAAAWAIGVWLLDHPTTTEYRRPGEGCPKPVGRRVGYWTGGHLDKDEAVFLGLDGYYRYKDRQGQMHRGTIDELMPLVSRDHGFWGLHYDVCPRGAIVLGVVPDLPAAMAGLREGDIITKSEGQPLLGKKIAELAPLLSPRPTCTLTVSRGGREIQVRITARSDDPTRAE